MTTSPSWQAACKALCCCCAAPSGGTLITSLVLCARSSRSLGRSLSITALSNQVDIVSSEHWAGKGETNARCSYLARIHDSLCSLRQTQSKGQIIIIVANCIRHYVFTLSWWRLHHCNFALHCIFMFLVNAAKKITFKIIILKHRLIQLEAN